MQSVLSPLRKVWHWLTSMSTALILLFLLALAAIPGALLPQRQVSETLVEDYLKANPTLGPIYDRLQFFDVFSSNWFTAIVTLLMVSLVGCIIPRSIDHWRAYRAKPTRAPKFLQRMPMHAAATLEETPEAVAARAHQVLGRWNTAEYTPEEDRAGAFSISAERGYARELMNLLFHIGLVGMIVFFAAGRMVYYEGQVIVVTNSESPYAIPVEQSREFCNTSPANFDTFRAGSLFDGTTLTPFCFESQNFRAAYLNTGQANGFWSDITYTDDVTRPKSEWTPETLSVNHPLRIHGDRIYLQGHGFAPQITVTWPNGESRTQLVQFRPTDVFTFQSSGVMRFDPPAGMYPDLAERRQNQIAIEGVFAPTAQWTGPNGDMLQSSFPSMEDPAMVVEVYVGDAGLDSGRPQNIFVLDQNLIADGRLQKVQRLQLLPGESAEVDLGASGSAPAGPAADGAGTAGPITVRFDGAAEFANYQISRDPFQPWILASTVLMLVTLAASLTIKRRRIWVRLTPAASTAPANPSATSAAGTAPGPAAAGTLVEIAGLSRTDRAGWGPEFDDLVEQILSTAPITSAAAGDLDDPFEDPDAPDLLDPADL